MKVNIQAVNFNVDRKLVDFINERLTKLEKYYDKIVTFDVFLKLDNSNEKENKCVDVKVLVPGDEMIVKKTAKTFEEAVDLCKESLERLLLKRKEKINSHL
ncbi:ribosome hibernation-promoting factor, HPF/YfiA family [Flavobacterium sp. HSC-61S13]|uniref:ribosome hibernation-promoting factor, HPF/YfiA family n=1 Tax=Flavobacterium sp. HSC-61S13 TaxID=2910963 RepID=UPI0020A18428|nr:ribosome-associated translation inhibitor RaiA [Flavobacterium sp. HSC-61S13]MCP1994869.1 putative sigma-54 modulation protein [Flavobacterium sp. HSC-61S13]